MRCHQGAKVKHFDVSNVIYHKFLHGAVSYTLKGENVNVMLEYRLSLAVRNVGLETDRRLGAAFERLCPTLSFRCLYFFCFETIPFTTVLTERVPLSLAGHLSFFFFFFFFF